MQRRDNGSVSIILGAGPDVTPAESVTFDAMGFSRSGKAIIPFVPTRKEKKKKGPGEKCGCSCQLIVEQYSVCQGWGAM